MNQKSHGYWYATSAKDGSGTWRIVTPHGRTWTQMQSMETAKSICRKFNFADTLKTACETGEMIEIKKVLLAFQ